MHMHGKVVTLTYFESVFVVSKALFCCHFLHCMEIVSIDQACSAADRRNARRSRRSWTLPRKVKGGRSCNNAFARLQDLIEGLTPIHMIPFHNSIAGSSLCSAPHSRSTSSMRDGLPAPARVPVAATRARLPDDRPRHGPPSRASAARSRAPQKNRQRMPQIGLKCLFSPKIVPKVPLALVGTT